MAERQPDELAGRDLAGPLRIRRTGLELHLLVVHARPSLVRLCASRSWWPASCCRVLVCLPAAANCCWLRLPLRRRMQPSPDFTRSHTRMETNMKV